jgi:NADH-quinone oxidoreductase subunit E
MKAVAVAKGDVLVLTEILAKYPKGDRGFLIPILQEVQDSYGYVSPDAVNEIGDFTGVSLGEIFGVASFYAAFRFTKPGKHTIKVCRGTACHVRGSSRILEMIERELKVKAGETTADELFSLERIACFGCCALAPVVVVDKDVHGRMSSTKARRLLTQYGGREG